MIAINGIQVAAVGKTVVSPQSMVSAPSYEPLTRPGSFGAGGDALFHFIQRFCAHQVNIELFKATGSQVGMSVIESGHDEMPAQINHLGLWPFQLLNVCIGPDGDNFF